MIGVGLLISACVSTPVYLPETRPRATGPGEPLFQQGEKLLEHNDFDQALACYSSYLAQYPQGGRADQSLNRIGSIYRRQGMLDASLAFYQRLLTQFPQSALVNDAHLAVIDLLFQKKQPAEATAHAQQILDSSPNDATRRRLWRLLADHYQDAGEMANAVAYAHMLYLYAPQDEKKMWAEQLKTGISRLDEEAIHELWDRMDDDLARSHMMYRYAALLVERDNYDEALEVLSAFLRAYPAHSLAREAAQLVSTLEERLSFAPHTIGCLLPLSGPYQPYGQRALNGIELALSLLQSAEPSSPIRMVIKDSASKEGPAVEGVRALAEARVGVILGPIATAPAAAGEAQKLHIPMVTFTQNPDITEIGSYIFRNFITPRSQISALVSYFTNGVGLRDFAIMYPRDDYGRTFKSQFGEEVNRQGGRVVRVASYDTHKTDFGAVIRKLTGPAFQDPDQGRVKGHRQKGNDPAPDIDFDVLFIPDAPKTAGLILPQLAYYDIRDVYLAGTNLWHSEQFITMACKYAQNAVMAEGFFSKSADAPVRRFVRAYREVYGREPGLIEAYAYDTARLLFKLVSTSDIRNRHDLRDALLKHVQPDGVTGPTAFADNGEAIQRLKLLKIKGRQFVEIPQSPARIRKSGNPARLHPSSACKNK
jgi:branched-chain amino acid transport system substrate-binding protein